MRAAKRKPARKPAKAPKKRVPKTAENDENCLHMHCAQWVRKDHPTLLAFSVANERKSSVQHGVKLKRKGVLAGVPDWLFFHDDGSKLAVELKDDKGTQTPEQEKFQERWERTGSKYYVVRTLEDFQTIVSAFVIFG